MEKVTKVSALALAITAALPMTAQADIMISEYVEGSGFSKAIEIYNSGTASVDLSDYTLAYYSKGDATAKTILNLSGNLAAGSVKVITNNHADNTIELDAAIDSVSAAIYFNGDDKVAILKGTEQVDLFGEIGTTGDWAKDVTVERNANVTAANSTYQASEWTVKSKNLFSGLGARNGNFAGGDIPVEPSFSCLGETITPIYDVQGVGRISPLIESGKFESNEEVTISGVVTARGESLFKGFYLQEINGDNSPYTSDGVFVYLGEAPSEAIQPGTQVCVKGKVKDFYGLTQIDIKADKKFVIGEKTDVPAPEAFYVADGESFEDALNRYEGMQIVLDAGSDMKVTRTFSYDYAARRNNMVLSHKTPLMKPTQVYAPHSDKATALQAANRGNELYIESDFKAKNGEVPYFPTFNAETGYIRVGDQMTNMTGVVSYSYGEPRLVVTNEITAGDFIRINDRTNAPEVASQGDIRVASFNVLNLFTSDSDIGGPLNPTCKDQADADASRGCGRGAHSLEDYQLQRAKIVNAITEMNADIIGLMEIENNGFSEHSSIQYLLDALNAEMPAEDAYSFIEATDADKYKGEFIGGDAIAVGILYRSSKVTPSGDAFIVATPEQHATEGVASRDNNGTLEYSPAYDKFQRHSLGQTFQINNEKLTVVVNHLKSKGSGCLEDWLEFSESKDPADLQGKCNEFRVSAAKVLGESLKTVEGGLLVIGDMNSYGMEDPIAVLTDYDAATANREIVSAAWTTLNGDVYERQGSKIDKGYGLINLNTQAHGTATFGYSYSGELGNLDHALANKLVADKLVAIEDWNINSVESSLFEYPSKYSGDLEKSDNAFSSSDHDPVIIALSYPAPKPEPEVKPKNDGGSLGYFGLMLLGLLGLRRTR
ncbi:extracellular exonuclease ExeM [Shewanella marinintestina]|uniref:extracellular exonuclease ExeM n=1 Tax=Shewanella marinintestina TaxID=190305 RepID=UPI00200EDBBA|nr:extracellular exonuclease ExeM [Shewanella marinintestina]MCL1146838.1 extracellular exonuclease ExeM [Shewanella marinintestina]